MQSIAKETAFFVRSGIRVALCRGDLTEETTDAIVNAANEKLRHGGGLAGMISRKGGKTIQEESDLVLQTRGGIISTGSCAVTKAGNLKTKWVIHAVGPIWSDHTNVQARQLLRKAINSVHKQAQELGLQTYSLTAISSGIFGYPKDLCAEDIIGELAECLKVPKNPETLQAIRIVIFDQETFDAFAGEFAKYVQDPSFEALYLSKKAATRRPSV